MAAPACGTCSRARELPNGPPPLRSDSEPDGLTNLTGKNLTRVQLANATYRFLADLIIELLPRGILILVENPQRSIFWLTSFWSKVQSHFQYISCEACAFGGRRPKKTAFAVSHPGFESLQKFCPGPECQVTHCHNVAHKSAIARMDELERELKALKLQQSTGVRGRSPTPPCGAAADRDRSPVWSRSPRDPDAELQVVFGGWKDARRAEAENEVKVILAKVGYEDVVKGCWAPYIRTTFLQVTLRCPDTASTLPATRLWQMKLIQLVKAQSFQSQLPGSEGSEIWVSKQRSVEERQKIQALVVSKEFIEKLGDRARFKHDASDIDWRGKLYIGFYQILGNAESDDPQPEDQFVADSKGNHTQWFFSASKVEKATGLAAQDLQQTWSQLMAA